MIGSEVKTYFQNHNHVDNYSDTIFIDWLRLVNRIAYRVLYKNDPEYAVISDSETMVKGTTQYGIFSEFGISDFGSVDTRNTGVYLYDSSTKKYERLRLTSKTSSDVGAYIDNNYINITGDLDEDEEDIRLIYIPAATTIADLTTVLNIPDEHIHWVSTMIKELYSIFDNRDAYDVSFDEQIEKSFKSEVLDGLSGKNRHSIDVSFNVF